MLDKGTQRFNALPNNILISLFGRRTEMVMYMFIIAFIMTLTGTQVSKQQRKKTKMED